MNKVSCLVKNDPGVVHSCIAFSILFIVLLLTVVVPAAATDTGGIILPDYHHIDISMANGGSYYVKFDGGGLNAMHITTSTSEPYGQITNTGEPSGTFYLTDTGGRGFSDDMILMVAVKGTQVPDDYKIHIKASGYSWTPTPVVNQPPAKSEITYQDPSVDGTFTKEDFIYGPQAWKPMNGEPYPIVADQDMTDPSEVYRFMFVDLHAGTLGMNSNLSGLINDGAVKVEYEITNPAGLTVFNLYAWCNQSNQGRGISWSNALDYTVGNGGKTTGGSGFSVKGAASPGQGGDTANPDAPGEGSVSMDDEKNAGEQSGFEGKTLSSLSPVTLNGNAFLSQTSTPEVNLTPGKSTDYSLNTGSLQGPAVDTARFWLFVSGSHISATGSGADPDFSLAFDGSPVSPVSVFSDTAGYHAAQKSATFCYDVKPVMKNATTHTAHITFNGPPDAVCTAKGGTLLVLARDETKGPLTCWIVEDCDIISADPGNGIEVDDPVTNYQFNGNITAKGQMANLTLVSTTGGPEPAMETVTFNLGEWQPATHTRLPAVQARSLNVTPFLSGSGNRATSTDLNTGSKGSFLENRVAVLVVTKGTIPEMLPPLGNITGGEPVTQQVTQNPQTILTAPTVAAVPRKTVSPGPAESGAGRHILPGPLAMIEDLLVALFGISDSTAAATGQDPNGPPGVQDPVPAVVNPSPAVIPVSGKWNLSVTTDPAGASVALDGTLVSGRTPVMIPGLSGGEHSVIVRKDGFLQVDMTVQLDKDRVMSVNLTPVEQGIVPAPVNAVQPTGAPVTTVPRDNLGGVYVDSHPGGATISVDGMTTNLITPSVVSYIREGLHTVSIRKEGVTYPKYSQAVRVFPEAVFIVPFTTDPAPSRTIAFEAPAFPGATMTVNGRGPELKLPARALADSGGSYVTMKSAGSYIGYPVPDFYANGESFVLKADRQPLCGVSVTSNPSGSDIFIDGFPTGLKTPAVIPNVSRGQHIMSVSKQGYVPVEKIFSLVDDPTKEIDAEVSLGMEPYMQGVLTVTSSPDSGAKIYIDGIYTQETTPHSFRFMNVGKYEVKVVKGTTEHQFDAEVHPNEEVEYRVDFSLGSVDVERRSSG